MLKYRDFSKVFFYIYLTLLLNKIMNLTNGVDRFTKEMPANEKAVIFRVLVRS